MLPSRSSSFIDAKTGFEWFSIIPQEWSPKAPTRNPRKRSIYRKVFLNSIVVDIQGSVDRTPTVIFFLTTSTDGFTEHVRSIDMWPTQEPTEHKCKITCSLDFKPTWVQSRSKAGSVNRTSTDRLTSKQNTILEMEPKEVRFSTVPLRFAETRSTVKTKLNLVNLKV